MLLKSLNSRLKVRIDLKWYNYANGNKTPAKAASREPLKKY